MMKKIDVTNKKKGLIIKKTPLKNYCNRTILHCV